MGIYNTARFFPCFPLYGLAVYIVHIYGLFFNIHGYRVEPHPFDSLYGLAVYIVHIYGLFFNIHGYRVEPHPFDSFDWMCIASRDRKQHCV